MSDPILVVLHTRSNTGYAIAPLERVFYRMAVELAGGAAGVHFAYKSLDAGRPDTLPDDFRNIAALELRSRATRDIEAARQYVHQHGIRTVFAFDAPVALPPFRAMRQAGVQRIISYLGAPMSSLNSGLRLLAKRLEVRLRRSRPEHFIFESEAMRDTAVHGRGIPARDTSVVYLGVDFDRYARRADGYAHRTFGIPSDRRIVVYSGHMEPRKGVHVLVEAFVELARRGRTDAHLLILGNQEGQADRFLPLYEDTAAADSITFGGYRSDIPAIFGSADIGAIASTGWDSFTMSSVEMAASELPLVVSDLQGLSETVDPEVTGYTFPPGNASALADRLEELLGDVDRRRAMGKAARVRAQARHSVDRQVEELVRVVRGVRAM